jgi:hypothetical protein
MTIKKQSTGHFLAYFDSIGFECILDLNMYERDLVWSTLKGVKPTHSLPLQQMIMRARFNPHRFPEIWSFTANIPLPKLISLSKKCPQDLADLIRANGSSVFLTPKTKTAIT